MIDTEWSIPDERSHWATAGTANTKRTMGRSDTDFRMTGVGNRGSWYGLIFHLNMGTPGELAGNAGLTADLLAAWSPKPVHIEGSYPAELGLALPPRDEEETP